MNAAVEGAPVHGTVSPVMPCVFKDEKNGDLVCHGIEGGEGDTGFHAEEFGHGVEEPDLGEFDGEVGDKDEFGALPLFGGRGNFLLEEQIVSFGDYDADARRGRTFWILYLLK